MDDPHFYLALYVYVSLLADYKRKIGTLTPKLEAANRSEAEAVVVVVVVVWAK